MFDTHSSDKKRLDLFPQIGVMLCSSFTVIATSLLEAKLSSVPQVTVMKRYNCALAICMHLQMYRCIHAKAYPSLLLLSVHRAF